jgi:hypothetical protein
MYPDYWRTNNLACQPSSTQFDIGWGDGESVGLMISSQGLYRQLYLPWSGREHPCRVKSLKNYMCVGVQLASNIPETLNAVPRIPDPEQEVFGPLGSIFICRIRILSPTSKKIKIRLDLFSFVTSYL